MTENKGLPWNRRRSAKPLHKLVAAAIGGYSISSPLERTNPDSTQN
jgi:hypothetical protein